jgi:hypothetical protein
MRIDLAGGTPVDCQSLPTELRGVVEDCHSVSVRMLDYPAGSEPGGWCLLPQHQNEIGGNTFVLHRINLDTSITVTVGEGVFVEAARKSDADQPGYAVYYDHDGETCYIIRVP